MGKRFGEKVVKNIRKRVPRAPARGGVSKVQSQTVRQRRQTDRHAGRNENNNSGAVAQGHRCQRRQEGRKDRKERVEFVICKFHPSTGRARTATPPPPPPPLGRPYIVHEDYFSKGARNREGPRRDSGPLLDAAHPSARISRVRASEHLPRGYIEILSPNFLCRNPLRSYLGLWTHALHPFIPVFLPFEGR